MTEVAIIGAAGTVGQILVDYYSSKGINCHCIDTDETGLFYLRQKYGVEVYAGDFATTFAVGIEKWGHLPVIHAAAYKHVGFCELSPRAAAHNNINKFARFLNESRIKNGVYISTDKAVEPRGVMGMTKAIAEKLALEAGWSVVRFGNVWGSRGSVVDSLERSITGAEEGAEIKIEARGGWRTRRYVMRPENVANLVDMALFDPSRVTSSIYVPDSLPEMPVKGLIADAFESLKQVHGRPDLTLSLVDAPLDPGEKYEESFIWKEEEEYAEDLGNGILRIPYIQRHLKSAGTNVQENQDV